MFTPSTHTISPPHPINSFIPQSSHPSSCGPRHLSTYQPQYLLSTLTTQLSTPLIPSHTTAPSSPILQLPSKHNTINLNHSTIPHLTTNSLPTHILPSSYPLSPYTDITCSLFSVLHSSVTFHNLTPLYLHSPLSALSFHHI